MIPYAIKIEWICFKELFLLVKRDLRYFYLVLSMYTRSLFAWDEARLLRAAYCLARHVDDVLDGDRKVRQDPIACAQHIIHLIEKEAADPDVPISRLIAYIFNELSNKYDSVNGVKKLLLVLFSTMMADHSRARNRLLTTEKKLDDLLFQALSCAMDISLIISRADTRSTDISDLIHARACLYTIRDLKRDLAKNLISVPQEVVCAAPGDGGDVSDFHNLLRSRPVAEWQNSKFHQGVIFLNSFSVKSTWRHDHRTKMVVLPVMKGL